MVRLTFILCVLVLSGCSRQWGPSCDASHSDPHVESLMSLGCTGQQWAYLHLGLMHEYGIRVEQDYKAARQYYEKATIVSSGMSSIYVPGAGNVAGYTMPVQTGPVLSGVPEASFRLGLLYRRGLGVARNKNKADALIAKAYKVGFKTPTSSMCFQDSQKNPPICYDT